MTMLAQISDTHLMVPGGGDDRADSRVENLRRCISDINSLDPKPDAVIFTGDMSQNARHDEYVLARDILGVLDMPIYITPGNRDSRDEIRAVFGSAGYFPPNGYYLHYAVTVGAVRLVSIDTFFEVGNRLGNLCDTRLSVIDETLGDAPHVPTALFMHHPPFDVLTSTEPFQFINREAVEKLADVIRRHPQIIRVFCGHAHRCYVSEVVGIKASTIPSIAVDLRLGDYPQSVRSSPIYQIHRYDKETGFSSETRFIA